jgi:hypothetical protein
MLLRRLSIAIDLVLRFLSRPAALTITAFPFILWFLKRLFFARTSPRQGWIVLLAIYVLIAAGLFAWKFVEAAQTLATVPKLYAEIEQLDSQEQSELKRLIRAHKLSIGPPVFERIASKTSFIYRDVSGVWRIEREYRWFLRDWAKKSDK